ncbi:MAG: flagellar M-ring protein FliF, partial [Hydrogenophilales bacterium 17-61-76]
APNGQKVLLMIGVAAVVAVMVAVWMWGQKPEYRVLFSNFSDRDGGAIVAELEKMNVPYQYSEGGSAVLVPADRVHDARLKLAAQGLPKGGNVGFELLENQKLGSSQFVERVNFQRAMEGELARSIESVSAVQSARVHLAMPKDSVFVSEQKMPTASVLLNLYPGRTLDAQQVSAIVHLVASSVPELPLKNVTIVDQNGNLLSDTSKSPSTTGMDPGQIKYVQELQQDVVKRIVSIISPIVGAENVRAEATADVDFSRSEQAVESFKPNQTPDAMAIRSQQTSESLNASGAAGGVPGALTNQPTAAATAPIVAPGNAAKTPAPPAAVPTSTQKDATTNYEVDKTIQYVQQGVGSAFASPQQEIIPETPLWKEPGTIQTAKDIGKYLLIGIALLLLYLRVLKPMLKKITEPAAPAPAVDAHVHVTPQMEAGMGEGPKGGRGYQEGLARAQKLASEDPRVVANIVKTWVGSNE